MNGHFSFARIFNSDSPTKSLQTKVKDYWTVLLVYPDNSNWLRTVFFCFYFQQRQSRRRWKAIGLIQIDWGSSWRTRKSFSGAFTKGPAPFARIFTSFLPLPKAQQNWIIFEYSGVLIYFHGAYILCKSSTMSITIFTIHRPFLVKSSTYQFATICKTHQNCPWPDHVEDWI